MCAILGLIRTKPVPEEIVRRAVNSMSHRGPDDAGLQALGNVWLGHRRLSIIDLSPRGHRARLWREGVQLVRQHRDDLQHRRVRRR